VASLKDIEYALPLLVGTTYSEESDATDEYNCIAFAFGDTKNWWWPKKMYGMYWPPGFDLSQSPDVLVSIFELHGYSKCDDDQLEVGYEKVAIFCVNDRIKHAARQLKSGRWASKLGEEQDIEHEKAEHVVSSSYGQITHFLKRKRDDWL
jgi:hypothetical protein